MIIYILWHILRLSFSTALVLAYVEIGPGGEYLGVLIDTFKSHIVSIDWNGIGLKVLNVVIGILRDLPDLIRNVTEK
jgi:hypothetical protein